MVFAYLPLVAEVDSDERLKAWLYFTITFMAILEKRGGASHQKGMDASDSAGDKEGEGVF